MAPAYHIASDDGLISIQVRSRIDLAQLYELAKSVLEASDYDPGLPLLADLRGMQLDWNERASEPFARFVIDRFRNRPTSNAIVLDPQMSDELVAAIYWLSCAVGGTEVFDDYDQAVKWLIRREFARDTGPNVVAPIGSQTA